MIMAITAAMVKELRERTGAGMMDCKKALAETDGDMKAAIDYLREKGIAKAEKKAGRIAAEGAVTAYLSADAKAGAIVEINCETDFAAGNEQFRALSAKIAKHIAETNPVDLDALNASTLDGKEVAALITEATATIGEKISLRRFAPLNEARLFLIVVRSAAVTSFRSCLISPITSAIAAAALRTLCSPGIPMRNSPPKPRREKTDCPFWMPRVLIP